MRARSTGTASVMNAMMRMSAVGTDQRQRLEQPGEQHDPEIARRRPPAARAPPDLNRPAQAFGHGEDPLTHPQRRDDMIDQVRRGLCHAPGVARRTQPAALAREGNQEAMPAVRTPGPGKTVGEDATLRVAVELALHVGRHALRVPIVFTRECEIGLQVLLDDLVEGGLPGMATAVRHWSASR